ncbi:MAG: nucleotidyltransferase family protein [Nitrospinae bacterium]|nr:nucleotidyltransferase family protein [Nitrospinota bacterium]
MKAIVLAAGYGERMRPLTNSIPKPLLPINGKPILHYTLQLLKKNGIFEIVINLHHLPDMIMEAFGDGSSFGMKIHYSYEKEILGTAGGIKAAERFLKDGTFLVINSDIIADIDIKKVLKFHKKKKTFVTMVLRHDPDVDRYGAIEIDSDGRIRRFLGKPEYNGISPLKKLMFTGIHIFEPEIFDEMPSKRYCGITEETYPKLINKNTPIYGYEFNGYWIDIGTPERYENAKREVTKIFSTY